MIRLKDIIKELRPDIQIPDDARVLLSKHPVDLDRLRTYTQPDPHAIKDAIYRKPSGLWYGFGWKWWWYVHTNIPEDEGDYLYAVDIGTTKILELNTAFDLKKFHDKYGVHIDNLKNSRWPEKRAIDWRAVAKHYDGIEIPNYEQDFREYYAWYYLLDAPCGCIWNPRHVSLTQIEGPK